MKIKLLLLLCFAFVFLNACNQDPEQKVAPIRYEFKEPTQFPFEINDVSTSIDLEAPDFLHQFIFYYRNTETTQQIKYILSKVLEKPENAPNDNMTEYKLENGVLAFYEEDETSQALWWETEDGFLARYIYFINGNTSELGEYKLEVDELIKLANEVQ